MQAKMFGDWSEVLGRLEMWQCWYLDMLESDINILGTFVTNDGKDGRSREKVGEERG